MLAFDIVAFVIAVVVIVVIALTPGAAQARSARPAASTRSAGASETLPATCVVHSLPAFIAQGEFATTATVADIVEVECDPKVYGTESKIKLTARQLFDRCKGNVTWYVAHPFTEVKGQLGVTVELDADGNATAALLAGPGCAAGESLISAHLEEEPFETFTTSFTVLPPSNTTPGVFALPATQVEDAVSSSVATIVETEFAGGSEKKVRIGSEELFARCRMAPHLHWIRMNGTVETGTGEVNGVELDNNGNAFVIALGDASCAEGSSLIEADLESKPFTTFSTTFTIEPPQPTGEPSFAIEKRQTIGGVFTTSPLKGSIGQTVDYEIIVKNTGNVPETFGEFSDPHCDLGTLAGGPGASPVAPGSSTTYTCNHLLAAVGSYTNEATVTGTSPGGTPTKHTSNQVKVEVPPEPAFTIVKLQKVASGGSFTTSPLVAEIGQTVDYEIIVTNAGNEALTFSKFTDPRCDAGTITGGPGATPVAPGSATIYTCSRALTSSGRYFNEAIVTGTPPGESSLPALESNQVVAVVPTKHDEAKEVAAAPGGGSGPAKEESPRIEVIASCESSPPVLRGASGPKSGSFTVQISSSGLKRVTFYLDGRKLKTLAQSQARGGRFTIKIDSSKLSYGPHKVSIKTLAISRVCASIARSGVFVRPFVARVAPKFTG